MSYRKGLQLFDHAGDTDEMMLTPIDIHPMDTNTQYSPRCDDYSVMFVSAVNCILDKVMSIMT